ncbi:MAG: GntR family transcriptional regulator [Planctomycetaceae bacterium]
MGARISEQAIAEEIGISRTPVRSAIHQLEIEGLLEQLPRYGTIVKNIDRQDLGELFDYRIALESYACELAATRITNGDLIELDELCSTTLSLIAPKVAEGAAPDPEMAARVVEADKQFHLVILRAAGNRRLMRSAVDSRLLAVWGRFARSQTDIFATEKTWQQHADIHDALECRDGEKARKAMVEHLLYARENALILYDRAQAEAHASEIMQRMNAPSNEEARPRFKDSSRPA